MNKTNICNNCGKYGHLFHQCKIPITSYGIILFRSSSRGIEYLMIRRKDSFGYIDFLRGKYTLSNIIQLQHMFNEMSIIEKERIQKNEFDYLWRLMWNEPSNLSQFKGEELNSKKKFDLLKSGIIINDTPLSTDVLIANSTTQWIEPEWEFPKGRRNYQETDLECSLREFEEETGYFSKSIKIIENIMPFEELFIGSNHKSYKHKYYLAYMDKIIDTLQNFQPTEVSKLEWKTIDECLGSIRPYNLEKQTLINNINTFLQEYRLY